MIYMHVLNRGPLGVRSPLDRLEPPRGRGGQPAVAGPIPQRYTDLPNGERGSRGRAKREPAAARGSFRGTRLALRRPIERHGTSLRSSVEFELPRHMVTKPRENLQPRAHRSDTGMKEQGNSRCSRRATLTAELR